MQMNSWKASTENWKAKLHAFESELSTHILQQRSHVSQIQDFVKQAQMCTARDRDDNGSVEAERKDEGESKRRKYSGIRGRRGGEAEVSSSSSSSFSSSSSSCSSAGTELEPSVDHGQASRQNTSGLTFTHTNRRTYSYTHIYVDTVFFLDDITISFQLPLLRL